MLKNGIILTTLTPEPTPNNVPKMEKTTIHNISNIVGIIASVPNNFVFFIDLKLKIKLRKIII